LPALSRPRRRTEYSIRRRTLVLALQAAQTFHATYPLCWWRTYTGTLPDGTSCSMAAVGATRPVRCPAAPTAQPQCRGYNGCEEGYGERIMAGIMPFLFLSCSGHLVVSPANVFNAARATSGQRVSLIQIRKVGPGAQTRQAPSPSFLK
jgi:hypothetical protein